MLLPVMAGAVDFPEASGLNMLYAETDTNTTSTAILDARFNVSKFTCIPTITGTAPTSITLQARVSMDGTTYYPIGPNHTYTVATESTISMTVYNYEQWRKLKIKYVTIIFSINISWDWNIPVISSAI